MAKLSPATKLGGERGVGTISQQVGVKPTLAAEKRAAEETARRIEFQEEQQAISLSNLQAQEAYETTLAEQEAEQAAYQIAVTKIQNQIKYGSWKGAPTGRALEIYRELEKDPEIARAIERGGDITIAAKARGYGGATEYQQFQALIPQSPTLLMSTEKGIAKAPTELTPTIKQSSYFQPTQQTFVPAITSASKQSIIEPSVSWYQKYPAAKGGGFSLMGAYRGGIESVSEKINPYLRPVYAKVPGLSSFKTPEKEVEFWETHPKSKMVAGVAYETALNIPQFALVDPWMITGTQRLVGGKFTKIKPPKPKRFALETQTPLKKGLVKADFKIIQVEPKLQAKFVPKYGEVTGEHIIFTVKPSTTRTIGTLKPIIATQKGDIISGGVLEFARTSKAGKPVSRFVGQLSGGQQPMSLTQFKSLPKADQYLLKQSVEFNLGRPVPEKFVPQFLTGKGQVALSNKQFAVGNLELQKLFRFSRQGKAIKITGFKPGRTTSRTSLFTMSEEVKTIGIKRGGVLKTIKLSPDASEKTIFSSTYFKESPKAFQRASGKVSKLDTLTYIKEPKLPKSGAELIISSGKQTTQATKQFPLISKAVQKVITKSEVLAIKSLPKTKVTLPTGISSLKQTSALTSIRTTAFGASMFAPSEKLITPTTTGLSTAPLTSPATKSITRPATKSITKPATKEITKTLVKPLMKPLTKSITKPATKTITKPIMKTITKPTTKPSGKPLLTGFGFPLVKPSIGVPFYFKLPKLKFSKSKSSRRRSKGIRITRKPSLVALGKGIKSTTKFGYEPSGLIVRPFLVSKKELKKKKGKSIFAPSLSFLKGGGI